MIYITGDTHNYLDMSNLSSKNKRQCCKEQNAYYKAITCAIVLGDFGLPWNNCPVNSSGIHPTDKTDKYLLEWYNKKPFKIFAVQGNHDNYDVMERLTFTDDGMFQAVLRDPEISAELVERLLHVKVDHVEYPKLAFFLNL